MQKFFVKSDQIEENKITIMGSDFNHIVNVLRMQRKEKLQICNTETQENYIAAIEEITPEKVVAIILEKDETKTEPNVIIDLYQGLPKSDKMEWIIQKTTEIGIHQITPIDMVRCMVKIEEKEVKKKTERWQKIAEGAAKQSKRDKIPKIETKKKFSQILSKISEYDLFFVAYEEEQNHFLKQELQKKEKRENTKIGILIGPEGGITKEEIELLKEKGAMIISLGKRILRTETAPIVLTSNLIYEWENEKRRE